MVQSLSFPNTPISEALSRNGESDGTAREKVLAGTEMRTAKNDRPKHGSLRLRRGWARLLWWGTLGELYTLVDVAL